MTHQLNDDYRHPVLNNLANTHHRILEACKRSERNKNEVRLMLVTKTVPVEIIQMVLEEEGENQLIGENLNEELVTKSKALRKNRSPEIHFIGNLNENELDSILQNADCIQTVDHYLIAIEMNRKLQEMNKEMDILIQVNTSRRDSPYGISPAHTIGLVLQIARLTNLHIKGLMTLGIFDTTQDNARACFRLLRNLFDELTLLKIPNVQMEVLSMGMSDHLETAIEEGSTLIRVGSAVFGERDTPDSFYWKE